MFIQRKPLFKPTFSKKSMACHYLGRNGHSINKCFIRNYPQRFKQVWVPKEVVLSNKNRPKMMWVPKGAT